jgi:hypothetical protein
VPDLESTSHGGDDIARELHALGAQIAALQNDVRRLQTAPLPGEDRSGWDDDRATPAPSFAWMSTFEPPRRSTVRVPRLPFELAFLAGAAALAGVAHLRPVVIAGVMGGAFLIVALAEWAGSRGDRLQRELLLSAPAHVTEPERAAADPAWFTPPVEHTMLAGSHTAISTPVRNEPESETLIAKLPELHDAETTVERRPGT